MSGISTVRTHFYDVFQVLKPPCTTTVDGQQLPPGWAWTCSCRGLDSMGTAFPTGDAALAAAEQHVVGIFGEYR